MAALAAVTVTGALHAVPITTTQDNIVTTKDVFVSTGADIIVKDGNEWIQIMDSIFKVYQCTHARAVAFSSGENADMQTVSLFGFGGDTRMLCLSEDAGGAGRGAAQKELG